MAAEEDGDPYGVLDIYQEKVRLLERLCSHPIPDSPETARLAGAAQPTLAQANKAVGKINEEWGRGECVCFPFYEKGKPVGWYFVGNTID